MGLFPGSKKYFKERSKCFLDTLHGQALPDLIVSDLMLQLYAFDSYSLKSRTCLESQAGTLHDLCEFLWAEISKPNGQRGLFEWQTHVVCFDVPGKSPRVKSMEQRKRSARMNKVEVVGELDPEDPDALLPSPFMTFIRKPGSLGRVIDALVPLFQAKMRLSHEVSGQVVFHLPGGPLLFKRRGLDVSITPLKHVDYIKEIGEGDLAACFWMSYFSARSTLVISKDTDMILLLALACDPLGAAKEAPSTVEKHIDALSLSREERPRGRQVWLRLDYQSNVDYVDINRFRCWLQHRYGTFLEGFMIVVAQGNDYVEKLTDKCGAEAFLDKAAEVVRDGRSRPFLSRKGSLISFDEEAFAGLAAGALCRGKLKSAWKTLARNTWWYMAYAVFGTNGNPCVERSSFEVEEHSGCSYFGWETGPEGVRRSEKVSDRCVDIVLE